MTYEGDVVVDYLHETWVYNFPMVLGSNLLLYILSMIFNVNTLVDFGWFFNQFLIALQITIHYRDTNTWKTYFLLGLITLWMIRGGGFILITRVLKGVNDRRYEKMAEGKSRAAYFFFQFVMQAVLVMFPAIPIYFMFRKHDVIRANLYVGAVIAIVGVIFELVADLQLHFFIEGLKKGDKEESNLVKAEGSKTFRGGLWKKSRHPNLFFEVVAWVGFAITALNDWISVLAFLGPFFLFCIMRFLTVPITEKEMKAKRPDWSETLKDTNMFWIF